MGGYTCVVVRLGFNLAAPTPAYLLCHMVEVDIDKALKKTLDWHNFIPNNFGESSINRLLKVGEEKDWPEDICRHLVEATLQVLLMFNYICEAFQPHFPLLYIKYWYCGYCTFLHIQDYGLSLNTPSKIAHCIFSVLKVIELSQLIFYVHFKMLTFNPDELSSRVATLNAFESWKPLAPNVNPAMLLLVSLVPIFLLQIFVFI